MKKVLIVMNIPTHIRTMREVANLLSSSGRYSPVFVYHNVQLYQYDKLTGGMRDEEAYVWTNQRFEPAVGLDARDCGPGTSPLEAVVKKASGSVADGRGRELLQRLNQFRRAGLRIGYKFISEAIPGFPSSKKIMTWYLQLRDLPVRCLRVAVNYLVVAAVALKLCCEWATAGGDEPLEGSSLRRGLLNGYRKFWTLRERSPGSLAEKVLAGWRRDFGSTSLLHGFQQRDYHDAVSRLFQRLEPVLVVLPEENLFYNHHLFVRSAHLHGVACCVVPFTIVNTLEWAEAFLHVPAFDARRWMNRILARAFPHWVLSHRGRHLILPASHILACESLNIVPSNPWLINSGRIDVIAVESRFMLDYYRKAGIQKEKLHLTGALSDDKLHRALKNREKFEKALEQRTGTPFKKKKVLIGLPPDQFAGGIRPSCEFESYDALIKFMITTVVAAAGDEASVLVNLHPRIAPESVAHLKEMGVTIVLEPIEDLIPLVDMYIAVASATIRLAIASGIPVVNYDAYVYGYDDYKNLVGVREILTREDFQLAMNTLCREKSLFNEMKAAQKLLSSNEFMIDGNAGSRLLAIFDELGSRSISNRSETQVSD
jgi:hypothetical protein